ncbi:MAG: RagB/SusD family nutrient uptake outer membrane protein [Tannerellaceae bacterium]|nr:RagB/SusD family nutrient uptake outer membrane protein [Tannerellaceae bacterium]
MVLSKTVISWGGGKTYMVFDNRGDDILSITSNGVVLMQTYRMVVDARSTENDQVWTYGYRAINRVNIFLDGLEEYNNIDVIGEVDYQLYVAEALFLRSLAFYYLSQLYSLPYIIDPQAKAIPLRLTGILEDGHSDCPAATITEVYEQILSDLDESTISALSTEANSYDTVTRVSQAAARMLRMRVYMAMENWEAAIREGEAISGYQLSTQVEGIFTSPYYNEESIFSMSMTTTNRSGTQTHPAGYYYSGDICLADTQYGIMSKNGYNLEEDKRI